MRRTLLIEGVPYAWGETVPDWAEQSLVSGIGLSKPDITRAIDPLGGVEKVDDVTFNFVDTQGQYHNGGTRLADMFRFYNTDVNYIIDPTTLPYDYSPGDNVTFLSDYHNTASALAIGAVAGKAIVTSKLFDDLYHGFTAEFWVLDPANGDNTLLSYGNNFIMQYGEQIEVNTYDGSHHSIISTTSLSTTKYSHLVVVVNAGDCYIYIDGAKESFTLAVPTQLIDTPVYLLSCSGAMECASIRLFSRAVSDAEVALMFAGKPISSTDLIFDYDMQPGQGPNLHDKSGNGVHAYVAANYWEANNCWVARQFHPGDLLYLGAGSARINARINSAVYGIIMGAYSCLEDGYKPYYSAVYPNDFTCDFYTDAPAYWSSRLIAYYEDNALKYLGRIVDIEQNGAEWMIKTSHILQPLADGFKPADITFRAAYDWTIMDYASTYCGFNYEIRYKSFSTITGSIGAYLTAAGYTADTLTAEIQQMCDQYWAFNSNSGFIALCDDIIGVTIEDSGSFAKHFFDSYPSMDNINGGYRSFKSGRVLKKYGLYVNDNSTFPLGEAARGNWFNGAAYINFSDAAGKEYYAPITAFDQTTGNITIGYVSEKETDIRRNGFLIESDTPIVFRIKSDFEAQSITELVYSILTSTGSGSNGAYDQYIGSIGCGLPAGLFNFDFVNDIETSAIQWSLDNGKIADDLAAMGIAFCMIDGIFKFIRIRPPSINQKTVEISDSNVRPGDMSGLQWGYHRPMSTIKYETKNETFIVNAVSNNIFETTSLRAKEFKTSVGVRLPKPEDWVYLQAQRLQWFARYAPTIKIQWLNHKLNLGQIVAVTARALAGMGRYGVKSIPGIVCKLIGDYGVEIVLNVDPLASYAVWVPSWEIASYSGTAVTLRYSEGVMIEEVTDLPATIQIITPAGAVLEAGTVVSAAAGVLTMVAAPTYDQTTERGIITLGNYTAVTVDKRSKYAWLADSDEMSNGDEGKKLL